MKPTLRTESNNRRHSHIVRLPGHGLPKTDYQFQPDSTAEFSGHCHGSPRPSFRCISDDYFKSEAPSHFVNEAAIFVLMAVTAAVPVVQGIRGASHILRAFGIL